MYRSTKPQTLFAPIALIVALGASAIAQADYQKTLAAQGADAYATTPIVIEIDNDALADTFSNNIVEANPALSDQEVMIELNTRMAAEQRLAQAAANLDPTAVAEIVAQSQEPEPGQSDTGQSAEAKTELESTTAAVASR